MDCEATIETVISNLGVEILEKLILLPETIREATG